jgi:eukaryotic-like serine/threonine-protein kinase
MGIASKPSSGARERELFLGALEKTDPRERAAFLEAMCGQDHALRQRLEDLLRDRETVGSFLEKPALADARADLTATQVLPGDQGLVASVTEKAGDRIGRYKLLQKIGEGGAGVVYMAEQEEPVRRRVALKVIKLGMDTRSVIARFEAERQALAMMEHPGIAKVLDAGATETGRPYFVMELVRGVKITDYCAENNLPARDRLELFIRVCQAIQHAHQKGIIHRDVKPSNILVTLHDGTPVPKVIDFGIVKATEQRLTDKTIFTQYASFIGTPAYMSPEQAEMSELDIDTRTDIYSLGVVLYELLTGNTPFDAETLFRAGLDECRRTIREDEPVRPSTRLTQELEASGSSRLKLAPAGEAAPAKSSPGRQSELKDLIHLLRGDLDWIVMKCLEKDRTRRYDAANDIALDVQRYLNDEPVLARPPSNVYRLQKLLHRHRRVVGAAAAIAVTLLGGSAISTWQAVRATRAERTALMAQQKETDLRRRAVQSESTARLNEYVADINLAQQSLTAGNYGRAVQLLEKHRPRPGEPDLRGFEWRYLWQVSQGDEHLALPPQDGSVQSVTVSPNGELLAAGLPDKVRIFNARTRAPVTALPRGANSMAFFPDGRTLVTASAMERELRRERPSPAGPPGGLVRAWNTADWTPRPALPRSAGPIALSRDGTRLATGREGLRGWETGREGVRVWDTATWSELLFLTNATGPLAFAPDGKSLATGSRAGITVWALDGTGAAVVLQDSTNVFAPNLAGPWFRPAAAMAFSPDGKWLVAARNAPSEHGVFVLSIWDARSGQEHAVMPEDPEHVEHTGIVSSLAFSPDGRILATASMDYSIRLWDFESRKRLATFQGHLSEVWCLAFSPDGQSLVSGAKDGSVNWWPVRGEQKEDVLAGQWQPPLAISKDSRKLAGLRQGTLVVVDLATREPEFELPWAGPADRGRFRPLPVVALSDDLKTAAQGLDDGRVQLWNTATRESTTLKVSERSVILLALSPDGRSLITLNGGFEPTLRWWDLRSGTNLVLESEAFRLLFSPDGKTLAAFQRGDTVELWDTATRSLRTNLVSELPLRFEASASIPTAAFSPDGRILATAGSDDAVRLWDTADGRLLGTCTGHKQNVSSVAFSPDGKTLATASDDRTLKLWNVATQQELLTIQRLRGALHTLLFAPDGSFLVGRISTSASTGGLRFYRAPLLSEIDAGARSPAASPGK